MKKFLKFLFKLFLVLIILLCLLVGGALAIAPKEYRDEALKEMSDYANSRIPVRAEVKKVENETGDVNIPLLDEGGIRVTITSLGDPSAAFLNRAPEITLKIENNTPSTKHLSAPFAKLNGYQFDTLLAAAIGPGETLYDEKLNLYSPVDYIDYNFTSLDELYVWFNILDENYDRYLIPEATVKLSEEESEYSHDESGTTAYDADGLKVIVRDTISRDEKNAAVYVSNLSDNYYIIECRNLMVDDTSVSEDSVKPTYIWMLPGTRALSHIPLGLSDGASAEAVQSITASFSVLRRTTFAEEEQGEQVGDSGPVTCPIHVREMPAPYADFTETVIAEQDGITVTATDFKRLEDRSGKVSYELYITADNDTDKTIYLDSEDIYLDRCGCYCSCKTLAGDYYYPVPAHESVDGLLTIEPTLEKYGIFTDPQTADCLLYYRDVPEEYGRGAGTVRHYLNCSEINLTPGAKAAEPALPENKLFSTHGVDFYILDFSKNSLDDPVLNMLIVNNSSNDFWIYNGDATKVNGKTGWIDLGSFDENVPAGGYCLATFRPSGEFDEIETLEFRLDLKDLYSAETIGKTRTVLVTIK